MRKLGLAVLFLLGGHSHQPVSCNCISTTQDVKPKRRHG